MVGANGEMSRPVLYTYKCLRHETVNLVWGQWLSSDLMWKRLLRMTASMSMKNPETDCHSFFNLGQKCHLCCKALFVIWPYGCLYTVPLTLIKADGRETSNCPVQDCQRVWASLCIISHKATGRCFKCVCVIFIVFFPLPLMLFHSHSYAKAAFCLEELMMTNPHNHLYCEQYAEVQFISPCLKQMFFFSVQWRW